jgi:hypothetical protein
MAGTVNHAGFGYNATVSGLLANLASSGLPWPGKPLCRDINQ